MSQSPNPLTVRTNKTGYFLSESNGLITRIVKEYVQQEEKKHEIMSHCVQGGALIELVCELTKMSSRHFFGFTRTTHIKDGIRVKVNDPFGETFESLVQMESCPAGGKGSHELVGVDVQVFTLTLRFVVDLHQVFVQTADVAHIVLVRIHEHMKRLRIVEHFVLHEIVPLTKLAPHGVQRHLGAGTQAGIFLNVVRLQLGPFMTSEIGHVCVACDLTLGMVRVASGTCRTTAGFHLEFWPKIDILFEEALFLRWKMRYFVGLQDDVTDLHCLI